MQLSVLRSRARTLLNEPSASYYSNDDLDGWANDALSTIVSETETVERIGTASTVAYQQEYSVPTGCIKMRAAWWEDDYLKPMEWEQYILEYGAQNLTSTGEPERMILHNNTLYIHPVVATSASEATLSGNHTSTITSLVVDSTTGFPSRGSLIAGSEVISYTNTTATKFAGCSRGSEGSTATSHSNDILLTERDITFLYYGNQTSELDADSDTPLIPTRYHVLIVYYMTWMGMLKAVRIPEAREYERLFRQGLEEMKRRTKIDKNILYYQKIKDGAIYGGG